MLLVSDREEDREVARQMAVGFSRGGREEWQKWCVMDYVLLGIGRRIPALHPCNVSIEWVGFRWRFSIVDVSLGRELSFFVNHQSAVWPLDPGDRMLESVLANDSGDLDFRIERGASIVLGHFMGKMRPFLERTAGSRCSISLNLFPLDA